MATSQVALYSYDGNLLQWIDTRRLDRLTRLGRVARVVRTRNGKIKRATLHPMAGEPKPTTLQDYLGTKYCIRQRLDDGHRCFRLRSLGEPRADEHNIAPLEVRPIFLRVLLECLTPAC